MASTFVSTKNIEYCLSLSYPILLVYDQEDDHWIARLPDLPGRTSDGANSNEAVENVADARQAWIESCIEDGQDVSLPTPDSLFGSLVTRRKEVAV